MNGAASVQPPATFLLRPSPGTGESLSSWRQRGGLENGFHLYPVPSGALRRVDPDAGLNKTEIAWLSSAFGHSAATISGLSLQSFVGRVFDSAYGRDHPRWLLQTRYSGSWSGGGPVFCPICLREGSEPFFRLAWRLGFVTECPDHDCEMRESCPCCGGAVWPQSASDHELLLKRKTPLGECPICRTSLAGALRTSSSGAVSRQLLAICSAGHADLTKEERVAATEFFGALDAICHLFMRNRSSAQIMTSGSQWADLAEQVTSRRQGNQVGSLQLAERRRLVAAAYPVMLNWPEAFLNFAGETGISQEHFSGSRILHPLWMQTVIDERLRKQKRGFGEADVRRAVELLGAQGRPANQANVRSVLGGSHATVINHMLGRRQIATRVEHGHVLDALERAVRDSQKLRKRSRMTIARDILIFLAAVHKGASIADACEHGGRAVHQWAQEVFANPQDLCDTRVRNIFKVAWSDYCTLSADDDASARTSLKVDRKGTSPARSAQSRLSRSMMGLDPRLARSSLSFDPKHFAGVGAKETGGAACLEP